MSALRRRSRLLLVAVALVAAAAGLGARATGALRPVELASIDLRFHLRGARRPPHDIVLVLIDDRTLQAMPGGPVRYPFARRWHARALDAIGRDHPRAIAYDVQFSEPTTVADDNALITAVARHRPVVLAATAVDAHGQTNVLGGGTLLHDIDARPGNVHFPLDPGGVFRRVPYALDGLRHFAVVAAETAARRPVGPDALGGPDAYIDYAGPPGTYPRVSFVDVVRHRVAPGTFRNRIVVVGASVDTLPDRHATPTTGTGLMTGSEILANAIDTVRRRAPLRPVPDGAAVALIILMALLPAALGLMLGPLRALATAVAAGALYAVAGQLAFDHGAILPLAAPLAALLLAALGGLGVSYIAAALERERTRALFARFVPADVVGDVLRRTDGDLRLGGTRRQSTVLFADLRGFTAWADVRAPEDVIAVLNTYLEDMSEAVMGHGGTLVSYMGDGIMAVFGAPLEQADHADRALAAAREMRDIRLPRFNAWLAQRGLGGPFRMGIGLNSGPVMSGNVGSATRLEYAAVGATTNVAARLEALTKTIGHAVLIGDATRTCLLVPADDLVALGPLRVPGVREPLVAWGLADGA